MIKNIFFDFDGVLAESVNVKTEAFRQLYLPFGEEIAEKVVQHHLANGGVSRFEKIKIYHKDFLNQILTEKEVLEWADQFSALVLEGVVNAPAVQGAEQFLKKSSYSSWIITGTPTEEIKEILKRRAWDTHFEEALGSPEKKQHWTEYLLNLHQLKREETIFIGDATADYEAALFSGLHFILRETEDNYSLFTTFEGSRIKDLTELDQLLKQY
jgi:HAD superfamily hydrolase (TIGR01549 family)